MRRGQSTPSLSKTHYQSSWFVSSISEQSQVLLYAAVVSSSLNLASTCFAGGRFPRDMNCLGFLSLPSQRHTGQSLQHKVAVPASRGKGQPQCCILNSLDKRVLPALSVLQATSSTTKSLVEKIMAPCKYYCLEVSKRQVDVALQ